jgi:hypothetical protein
MAKQCELIIGYLLPRRCEEKVTATCLKCGRGTCELHTRIGDTGLLCRDCYEEHQPLAAEEFTPLPAPVQRSIYRRGDFLLFEGEEAGDAFSTLS